MLFGKLRNRKEKAAEKADQLLLRNQQASYVISNPKEFDTPAIKYKVELTMKQWNKISEDQQQILTNTRTVILLDHETRKEKLERLAKGITLKNFDKYMKKFDKAQTQFWKEFDEGMNKGFGKGKAPDVFPKDNMKVKF